MTYKELKDMLKRYCSRFILLGGFGCVELFVPYRDVKLVKRLMKDLTSPNEHCGVHSLHDHKITMKKGEYVIGLLHEKTFKDVVTKYFRKGLF